MGDLDILTETHTASAQAKTFAISRAFVAKSVVSNWSYLILSVLVAFWMTPFVLRHLGDSSYGIWALVLQLTGYMGVVDVGLRSALIRFVSRFKAQGDDEALNRLLNSTITLYALMVPVCFLVAAILAIFVLPRMHIPPGMLRVSQITVFVSAGCVACDFVFATSHACLVGLSRWVSINSVWISVLLLRTALTIAFLKLGFGLLTLALIQLSVTFLGYSAEVGILRELLPKFKLKWQMPQLLHMRPIMTHGWYSFLLSLANRINYQVDSVVIALFLPISQVTFYVIGLRLIESLRDLLNSMAMIVAPLVSSFDAVGETHRVATTLIQATRYSLIVGFLGVGVLLGLGADFIRLWMGPRFAGPSGIVLTILVLGVFVSCSEFTASHMLIGLSKHKLNVSYTIAESALNLAFSLVLVREYGIFGVAAGTAIANFIIRGLFYPHAFLKAFGVSWHEYLSQSVLPILPPAVSFLAGISIYKHFLPIRNYPDLILAGLVGLALFVIILWFFSLNPRERELIKAKTLEIRSWKLRFGKG
jgi:O-antigen/teichoic acid export membrane protein